MELASISSYCDSIEGFLGAADAVIPEADLVNIKHQCSEYMQQLQHAENEEIPQLRSSRFDFSGDSLRNSIANLGVLTFLSPVNQRSRAQPPAAASMARQSDVRGRARWSESSARMPIDIRADDSIVMRSPSPSTVSHRSRPSIPAAVPQQHYRPVPPYQTEPLLTTRPSRNDSSWMQPSSTATGDPPQSIYLPSRTEDYMFAMTTNTDDVSAILEEMRRQEQWEMNTSIRENARHRNTQQQLNLFEPQGRGGAGRGQQQRSPDRLAGLMGGGGVSGAVRGGRSSPDMTSSRLLHAMAAEARIANQQEQPNSVRHGPQRSSTEARNMSHGHVSGLEPMGVEAASLLALEDEIHHMETSNAGTDAVASQNGSNTTRNQQQRGPEASNTASTQGAAAVSDHNTQPTAASTESDQPSRPANRARGTNPATRGRGRGRGVVSRNAANGQSNSRNEK